MASVLPQFERFSGEALQAMRQWITSASGAAVVRVFLRNRKHSGITASVSTAIIWYALKYATLAASHDFGLQRHRAGRGAPVPERRQRRGECGDVLAEMLVVDLGLLGNAREALMRIGHVLAQIGFDTGEEVEQLIALGGRKPGQCGVACSGAGSFHLREDRRGLGGQVELYGAAIIGVGAAFNPARAFQAIDQPRQ
ncbi:conserved hypothetical protein [Ricinus communis]|uniref:Uncharacterized protein n=1 Tax=Ricinus communis TaxID=3988 RepID=B9T9Y3_RICCO|nr:conserved hypothetical protein [Ricinus communis]